VPLRKAFAEHGAAQLVRAALSFDAELNTVVAIGHQNFKGGSQLTLHSNSDRRLLAKNKIASFVPSAGSQIVAKIQISNLRHETIYIAGQSETYAAIAAVALRKGRTSEPAVIHIRDAAKVEHLFAEESDRRLFGTASDTDGNIDVFAMKVGRDGIFRQGSLKVSSLTSAASVTSVLPQLKDKRMHMMVQTPSADHVYIVFDLAAHQVVRAIPMAVPRGPLMSMLTHVELDVEATMIIKNGGNGSSGQALFRVTIEEEGDA